MDELKVGSRVRLRRTVVGRDDKNAAYSVPGGTEGVVKVMTGANGGMAAVRFMLSALKHFRLWVPTSTLYVVASRIGEDG